MAKKESNLKNMLFALLLITLIASASLGGIYELTKEPIAAAKLEKKNNAIKQVIPEFDNNPTSEVYKAAVNGDTLYFYPGKKGNDLVGTAVETYSNLGFSGEIKVMVGFLPDGTINDVAVLEHEETPGLGDKMERKKSDWSVQFQGKNPETFRLSVKKDGGDVDAITASTISSRAFCDAVARAYEEYKSINDNK
ncbi:MAG TPA: RnfABCDGE type electron transport complex subunit G [Bacteroidetes bacterium]|nr:RnfABCDGE type electron transport complex subunit G [Bacteroidota bacterium]